MLTVASAPEQPICSAALLECDAEGIGLMRTEFLFLDRRDAPTVGEQHDAYSAIFAPLEGRKVVVWTLDAGADEPLRFAPM